MGFTTTRTWIQCDIWLIKSVVQKIGVKYIQAVITTLHRCITSRKKTANADSIMPKPIQKHMSNSRQTGRRIKCQVGATRKKSITRATATKEKEKLTSENNTFCTGNTQRCTLTFYSNEDAQMMAISAWFVDSDMTENVTLPTIK